MMNDKNVYQNSSVFIYSWEFKEIYGHFEIDQIYPTKWEIGDLMFFLS